MAESYLVSDPFEELSATLAPSPPRPTGLQAIRASAFDRELARQLANVGRFGPEGAVVRLDVDRLVEVRPAQAQVITAAIGRVLLGVLRPADVLARIGPDDFAVLLPRADVREAALTADALLTAIHDAPDLAGAGGGRVTVSAGVTLFDRPGLTVTQVIAEAESALAEAKEAGPGRVAIATARDRDSDVARAVRHWESDVRAAILAGAFELHGQPVVDIATRRVEFVEALVRLRVGDALVTAARVLPVAERWSLARPVDDWVIEATVAALAQAGATATRASINVSAASLADPAFGSRVGAILSAHSVDPELVAFEIAEPDVIAAPIQVRRSVERLRALACGIVLDGVVDCVPALGALGRPPASIKLAGELVAAAGTVPIERAIIHGLVDIARNLGVRTVATRLEDAEGLAAAEALGVDQVQGHAIGAPAPFEELIAQRRAA